MEEKERAPPVSKENGSAGSASPSQVALGPGQGDTGQTDADKGTKGKGTLGAVRR